MKKTVLACAAACALALPAAAAPVAAPSAATTTDGYAFSTGLKGLSFALPTSGTPTFGFTYFVTPTGALRADVGINFQIAGSNPGPGTDFSFSVALAYRAYLARYGRLYPFLQPGLTFSRVGGANASGTVGLEGSVGVEYFLLDRFSIAGATGLAFNVVNIAGVGPSVARFTTATTSLFANFYF